MPDHLNIVTAQIAGFFVTSVLYGFYLCTFFQCLYILVRSKSGWRASSDIQWGLVVVTLALFLNGTFNISLGLLRLIQQFSLHMGPVAWVNTVKFSTVNLQTMIGEGVMIYRCFHVWGGNWVVITPPLALWFADLGIALWESWLEGTTHTPLTSGSFPTTASVFWGLIATINIYTTGMIVYRIWDARVDARGYMGTGRGAQSTKMTRLDSIIRIVVDSALGYTLVSFTLFLSQVARSNALYIASGAEIQAVGIAFNLINIRVADLRNEEQEATRIANNGKAEVNTGPQIRFATASVPTYELSSTFADSQQTQEKGRASCSSV
ncbi:hypothetical protein M413DRAFT_23454 [Hebeloma cylindrosporum]|uniref:Uncharacterized protein n=1 Tax=Hebeloma cylindrosporum TaxID=76867 RepID=A0A0C3CTM4_HEBCY|nr:hypothetical protein M413DRAFT_23454 [Hebeloma cylindrosporum h7]